MIIESDKKINDLKKKNEKLEAELKSCKSKETWDFHCHEVEVLTKKADRLVCI